MSLAREYNSDLGVDHWTAVKIILRGLRKYFSLISTLIKRKVGNDGVPVILQYRSSDLYLTDRKETMEIFKKIPTPLSISANVDRGAGIFLQNCHSLLSIRQI